MVRFTAVWLAMLGCIGCQTHSSFERSESDQAMFAAVSMRLHPTFTQLKDWSGSGHLEGVDAVVEMRDQFGDPTRATGQIIFELYRYRFPAPDPKGERLAGPWTAAIATRQQQVAHWNSAIRGYSFQLADRQLSPADSYVLTAQFDNGKSRLFDQLIIEASQKKPTQRGHRTVSAPSQDPASY